MALSLTDLLDDEALKVLIERAKKLRGIKLDDLPMQDITRWLENRWQPNAAVLLQPGSVTSEMLAPPQAPQYIGITPGVPGFQNSWVNFDGNTPPGHRCAMYYKDRGRVYLGGVVSTGAAGSVAFTLPLGYRPLFTINNAFAINASGGPGYVVVSGSNGNVQIFNLVASTSVTTHAFLDGIDFLAA